MTKIQWDNVSKDLWDKLSTYWHEWKFLGQARLGTFSVQWEVLVFGHLLLFGNSTFIRGRQSRTCSSACNWSHQVATLQPMEDWSLQSSVSTVGRSCFFEQSVCLYVMDSALLLECTAPNYAQLSETYWISQNRLWFWFYSLFLSAPNLHISHVPFASIFQYIFPKKLIILPSSFHFIKKKTTPRKQTKQWNEQILNRLKIRALLCRHPQLLTRSSKGLALPLRLNT